MKKKITFLIAAAVMLLTMMASTATAWGQTRTATDVLTLDCATPAPTGSTSTALSSTSDVATFLNAAAGLSSATNKITCSDKTGDVYKGKGSGGGNIPQQCLKIGKASGPGSITFTIPEDYDNIDIVEITCYGWKTSSSISINSGTAQTFSTAQVEVTKTFELASSTRTITIAVTSSAVCITEIVLKKNDAPTVATPIFNPAEGIYSSAQNVTISTTTGDATIYYTIDGSDPTTSSSVYSTAIPVSTTTTIKAMATASGYDNSSIASATYTIVNIEHAGTAEDPYTVADARAAIDANTGMTGVYATGIVSQIVTPYDSGYSNITFNIVDEAGDEVFLQAYRCGGTDAANVQVGYTAVVTGNLTKYGNTYEFAQGCTLVSLTPPATPYITANDVEIAYDATVGSIAYTINNPVSGGQLTAATTSDWLVLGDDFTSPIAFTCTANDGSERTATVTLTYTYTAKAIVTKSVTVTQATNPNAPGTENNPYTVAQALAASAADGVYVQGTISQIDEVSTQHGNATYWISDDGTTTGQMKIYRGKYLNNEAFTAADQIQVGDIVKITGNLAVYNSVNQLGQGNYIVTLTHPAVPSITITPSALTEIPACGDGGELQVTCANLGDSPELNLVFCDSEGNETTYGWLTGYINANGNVVGNIATNTGAQRTGYLKVCCTSPAVCSNIVSITQVAYEAPTIATLPFSFNGGQNEIATTAGIVESGLGSDFGSDPKLKFKLQNSYVIVHFDEVPGTLSFDIKGDSDSWTGTFQVQTSADNVTYTVLENYSDLTSTVQSEVFALNENVRYIKWVYTYMVGENRVALGNISVSGNNPMITVNPDMVEAPVEGLIGELTVTYQNVEQDIADIMWTDEFGAPAGDEPNWVDVDFDTDYNIIYDIDENIDDARVAYFVVYSLDSESNDIYSNVVTISQAGAVTPVGDKYVKVTSSSDFTDGQYLIVYEEGGLAFDGSLETLDASGNTISVNISNNEIPVTSTTAASEFTIAAITDGYSIQSASGYYIGQTSDANGMKTSETEVYTNTISIDTDGNANVIASGGAYMRYNATSGQERFRYFKSSTYTNQNAIQLYKKATGPVTPSITANDVEIAYDVTSGAIEYTINNPYEGGSISAQVTTGGDWPLAISSISETSVNFTIPENESAEDRTGVIRLTYTYGRALVTKDVNVTQTGNPALVASITVNPDLVEVEAAGGDGELTVTYQNVDPDLFDIQWTDAEGNPDEEPNWIDLEINSDHNVYYLIDENNEANARVAYFVVYGLDNATDYVYSNVVTISQAGAVTPGTTGTIVFGKTSDNSSTPINAASVTGNDNLGNTWTITTVGTTSFTNNNNVGYAQVGSGSAPASSITFTTTLPSSTTITAFEAKFGGFSGTAGDITLIVDETTVGTGALNAGNDVVVENSTVATGTTLTVTVTDIAKGVKCYYISYTISEGSDPIIIAQNTINLSSTDTYGEFEYEVINSVPGTSLNATTTDSWISNINVTVDKVTFTTTPNTSTTDDREGTITLSYEGAANKTVSVIQSKVDYATLPFAFDGGRADIETTVGLTQNGLDSDYGASPKLKFNTTGDWVILKLNAGPASLSYDIKGNGFSGGTFDVEISVDGVTYTNIAQYKSFGSDVQPVTHIILDDNTRYVRWIYTEKSGGNVALGNIHASANYDIYGTLNIDSFDATMHPTTVHEKGIINAPGMVMSSQPDDLVIEDGGQVITNVEFMATLQKNISGYGDDPTVANGWYLISSPVANLSTSAVTIGTYDLFAYEEATAYWWSNTGSNQFTTLAQGVGYLYANSANQTLNFAGTMVGTNTAVEKAMTAECTYDNLKGYNLMGNPFTCNLGNGDIMIGATAITSVLVAEGGDDYVTVNLNDDGAVKPGQGFMVQTAAPATLTLNPGSSKGANSGFVRIVAGNENATDKAYINVANGNTLRKISLSDNTTQVYVMNDDKDYAAARVEELAGTMPVHFKAAEDGEYTITIEAVNADVEYMHLIDNFTGNDIDLLLESSYTFNATTNDSEARFRLDFGTYGVNEIAENNTFAYQYGNEIVVNGEGELQIFDLMGRMIMNTKINGVQSVNVPSNSVYILKLNNNIQKIVVK